MSQEQNTSESTPKRNNEIEDMMFAKHWQMSVRIFGQTLVVVGLFTVVGYYLDQLLGTKPLFIIIAVLSSFVASQVINYYVFRNLINKKK